MCRRVTLGGDFENWKRLKILLSGVRWMIFFFFVSRSSLALPLPDFAAIKVVGRLLSKRESSVGMWLSRGAPLAGSRTRQPPFAPPNAVRREIGARDRISPDFPHAAKFVALLCPRRKSQTARRDVKSHCERGRSLPSQGEIAEICVLPHSRP